MSPTALPKLLLLAQSARDANAGVHAKGCHHCLSISNAGGPGPGAQSADRQGSNSTETVVVTRSNDSREKPEGLTLPSAAVGCLSDAVVWPSSASVGSRGIQAIKLLYGYAEMRSKHRPSGFRASPFSGIPMRFSHRNCQSSFQCCVLLNLELVDIIGELYSHTNALIVFETP